MGLIKDFEESDPIYPAILDKMREIPSLQPMMHMWDYLKDQQEKRDESVDQDGKQES